MELKRNKIGGVLSRRFFDGWGWYLQQMRANEFSRLPCLWLALIMDLRVIALWDITWGQVSEVIFHYNFVKKWLSAIDGGDGSTSWYGKICQFFWSPISLRYVQQICLDQSWWNRKKSSSINYRNKTNKLYFSLDILLLLWYASCI